MGDISTSPIIHELELDDFVVVVQDGCVKIISKADLIEGISLGGFSICELWLRCVDGIGTWSTDVPVDTPPTMNDVIASTFNRNSNYVFTSDQFLDQYYDAEGNAFGKIIIAGGDVSGYSISGVPLFIGQVITADQLGLLKYEAKNTDNAYGQEWFFNTYDINNVEAE